MRGNAVEWEDDAIPADVNAVDDIGLRLEVPAVGLDVPVGSVAATAGVVTPPGFTSAYLVTNMGAGASDPAQGTVYVAMQSLRDGGVGPGNYLIDVEAASASVAVGTEVRLGDATYRVAGSRAIAKGALAGDDEVWRSENDRLVLITCLQRSNGGPSVENVVIFADRVG